MRVLVTGATGFLGSELIDALLAAGHDPRALVRATSNCAALEERSVPTVCADLSNGEGLREALLGVDAVVHCAGGGKAHTRADFRRNNTQPTATLLAAVREYEPALRRFVLVSSLAARGPGPAGSSLGPVSEYGRSKAAAEDLVLATKSSLAVTILRAPALYGPGDWRMVPLFRAAAAGFCVVPAAAQGNSLLHGRDCAAALLAILEKPHPSGRIYTAADGSERSAAQLVRAIGAARSTTVRVVSLPTWMLRCLAVLIECFALLTGREVLLSRDKVRDLSQPLWLCDSAAIEQDLGWRATIATSDGLRQTAKAYVDQGLLKRPTRV